MKLILKTKRLYLREFLPEDGLHFFEMNNDPDVIRFTGDAPFDSLKNANDFVKTYPAYSETGYGRWAVCNRQTHEFIGWCGLKFDPEYEAPDLGFRLYKKFWSDGIATEAAKAVVIYGFEELKLTRIIGKAYSANKASIKVLEKCNFKYISSIIYDGKQAVLYQLKNASYKRDKAR